jgi:phage replication initiation protein
VQAICRWINALKGHGTRVDVALDDRVGHATVSEIIAAADAGQAVMRWRTYDAKRRCSHRGQDDVQGQMITFGSRQSESYLRIYDKCMEAAGKGETVEGPWVRWELEFKKERAQLCVDLFAHLPLEEWREFTVGLLKSCISFRDTSANAPAWERCRSPELLWWKALTEGFAKSRFHVETTDRKLEEVMAWFSQAMGPTLAALYCAVGPEWITKVIQSGSSRWKPPHYQIMKKPKPKRPYLLKAP